MAVQHAEVAMAAAVGARAQRCPPGRGATKRKAWVRQRQDALDAARIAVHKAQAALEEALEKGYGKARARNKAAAAAQVAGRAARIADAWVVVNVSHMAMGELNGRVLPN